VVGVNPSTATREKSGPTAANVERVVRAHGYDGFVLVNLCPVRATDCRALPGMVEPGLLKANLEAIGNVAASVHNHILWVAWGAPILTRPFLVSAAIAITACVEQFRPAWRRFGPLTVGGHPRHPSRLNYAWTFAPFDLVGNLIRLRPAVDRQR
jgi:hypothetical protein